MATRKQLPQPRACAQCGTTFHTARKGHVHCSSACNTRAWRQRKPTASPKSPLTGPPVPPAPSSERVSANLAFSGQNVGTIAVGTAAGNLLSDFVKTVFTPKANITAAPASAFPTWPPAELLAAAQPAVWVSNPTWPSGQFLAPVAYHRHTLHLYVEAGLTWVLWQAPTGDWHPVNTPADLAYLAANPPLSPSMRALITRYMPTYEQASAPTYALPSAQPTAPEVAD
ncbi:MAG: hypothetical protein ACRYG7_11210 [Janthinobacterium lividum]